MDEGWTRRIAKEESHRVARLVALVTQVEDIRANSEAGGARAQGHPIALEELEEREADRDALQILSLALCTTTLRVIRERRADTSDRSRSPSSRVPRTPSPTEVVAAASRRRTAKS